MMFKDNFEQVKQSVSQEYMNIPTTENWLQIIVTGLYCWDV